MRDPLRKHCIVKVRSVCIVCRPVIYALLLHWTTGRNAMSSYYYSTAGVELTLALVNIIEQTILLA